MRPITNSLNFGMFYNNIQIGEKYNVAAFILFYPNVLKPGQHSTIRIKNLCFLQSPKYSCNIAAVKGYYFFLYRPLCGRVSRD